MQRQTYISFLALFAALLISSCSENNPETGVDGEQLVEYGFRMRGTKSGSPADTTYRAILLAANGNPGVYPYITRNYQPVSGSYRAHESGDTTWLSPCQVNTTTGEWIADDHLYGLRYTRGSYFLTFVSPAVAPQQYKWNETTHRYEEWGFLHHRQPVSGEPHLFISSPVLIDSLEGNHIKNQAVYDVPDDVVLKERRAKVQLQIKCGDDLPSVTVKKIGWSNTYESAYYNLRLDTLDTFTLAPSTDTVFVRETPIIVNNGDAPAVIDSTIYLFPLRYSQKDSHDEYIYDIPEIDFYIAQRVVKLQMLHNLTSQYTYTYTVTINSMYANVDVTSAPWDELADEDASIDETPSYTFTFDSAWEDKPAQSGEIN